MRITGPLVGIWLALFSLPLFLFTPDRQSTRPAGRARRSAAGLDQLRRTFANLRRYRAILRFLIARMIYTDGLNTLFAFGGIYAAGTFGMAMAEVIQFGILLNVTAGLGALGFAWIDDWLGAKRTILIALVRPVRLRHRRGARRPARSHSGSRAACSGSSSARPRRRAAR